MCVCMECSRNSTRAGVCVFRPTHKLPSPRLETNHSLKSYFDNLFLRFENTQPKSKNRVRSFGLNFGFSGSCGIFRNHQVFTTIVSAPTARRTIIFFASTSFIAFSGAKHWLEESGCFSFEKIHCTKTFECRY